MKEPLELVEMAQNIDDDYGSALQGLWQAGKLAGIREEQQYRRGWLIVALVVGLGIGLIIGLRA